MLEYHSLSTPKIHICTTHSRSGITDYARIFHEKVLASKGYILTDPQDIIDAIGKIPKGAQFHVQLGIFQHRERIAITRLLQAGYANIDVTIHDPPFVTFPYFQFNSPLLMRLSRGMDWYLGAFGTQRRMIEKLRRVFVLSEGGRARVLALAPRANVIVIPHIVDPDRIWPPTASLAPAMIYFGFIGPNKGLDYVLELHEAVRAIRPTTQLHVVGQASGLAAERYLCDLQDRYKIDVTFHGYVPDADLDLLFEQAAHVVLPYTPYKHVMPASGSVIHALRRARIVWTTDVNVMGEMIQDGQNGFMLSMNVGNDARRMASVMADPILQQKVSLQARDTALAMANYPYARHFE
ncbi:glycosyltransferase family 4 protein [Sphingomonas pseudosanguinis]|uniref:Glycosyltransferase involved in cell wall biosynthesis n=1 Tax=Sphingomonas pseudosanguinis TaxID=413712 RepID=A0A7W6F481_9SPHN|nr:glycosyltransferase family 4 protein [Sphingomonas pseudosanguinis]MBB3880140.1 glycosyltransferase involved in cell wall biosynthesis [Sphingomonas pseudosanguinis]MBN3538575.1 glycosyltransferase family 4 protein [Sphingomonas pseudosanguinis]